MGSVIKRAENSYTIIFYEPDPVTGKKKQGWRAIKGTKKHAQAVLTKIEHEINTGAHVAPSNLTVAAYFERWFTDYAAAAVNPHTLDDYRHWARMYIVPTLGEVPLDTLRPLAIQGLYTKLLTVGGTRGKPLSAKTVRHVHGLLRNALKQAVAWQLIQKSPMEGVRAPAKQDPELAVLQDTAAVRHLLDTARGTWLYIPALLALGAALRRGEVLALRWTDINFDTGRLTVRAGLLEVAGVRWEAPPKTDESNSTIDLPAFVLAALKAHKANQAERYLEKGEHPEIRYVVARADGTSYNPDHLTHAFAKLADQAECPDVTFHGLRRTCGTYLLEQGVPLHVVSSVMRHTDEATTLRSYAQVLRRMKERSAVVMDGIFAAETSEQWTPKTANEKPPISRLLAEGDERRVC